MEETKSKHLGYKDNIKALLSQIIIGIVRNYKIKNTIKPPQDSLSPLDNKSLLIEEYFLYEYRNLSLKDLAHRLNLSTRQTERVLENYYNKNFQQMKLESRMSIAAILLREENTISYVALNLGFSSLEHFSTAFKKYYKISPSQFKKSPLH